MILLPALAVSVAVLMPSAAPVFGVTVVSTAQDPAAIEASLALDRPTRELIQEGLSNEGFDPGTPDGLFGPRTRGAIRQWQEERGAAATGYLDGEQAEFLRSAGTLPPPGSGNIEPPVGPAEVVTDARRPTTHDGAAPTPASVAELPGAPAQEASDAPQQADTAESPAGLPPEILVDRHLVRVERLLEAEDYRAAQRVMNQIVALQREHDVALPAEFPFRFAEVAFAAGRPETAVEYVNAYLLAAGRDGDFYREALELLDSAEEAVRRAVAERRRADAARQRAEDDQRRAEALQRENDELARRQREAAAVPLARDALRSGGLAPEMVTVAAGRFQHFTRQRGSRNHLEWVTFDRPFAIGKYEVTRVDFELFVDRARYRTEARRDYGCEGTRTRRSQRNSGLRWNRPGFDQTDRHPVTCVSIRDAIAYADWLSQETGQSYRLPSAAEWQYAARAGSGEAQLYTERTNPTSGNSCGRANLDESDGIGFAITCRDGVRYTTEVGRFSSNHVGVHDMIGNVEELVLSCLSHETSISDDNSSFTYFFLAPDGSQESLADCDTYVAVRGGAWYSHSQPSSFTSYRDVSWLRLNAASERNRFGDNVYHRSSQNWTGFRLLRELP